MGSQLGPQTVIADTQPCAGPTATATGDLSVASSFCDTAWNSTWPLNGDRPYCSRTFHTQDELLAWAEEQRVQTLAEGWS